MKPRTIIPLIIGLGVGFFAIKMGIDLVKEAQAGQGDTMEVLISATPIEVATRITESMLTTKSIPKALVPADAFTDLEALPGRVTAMSIGAGVPFTQGMLAPPGSEPGLRAKIPPGYRAVSISVNEESAVAGFVMPGSRVDVLAGAGRDRSAKLILSDVEVGAVGQSLSEVSKDGRTVRVTKSVTLFLRPEQVEVLHQYAGSGRANLRLALRGNAEPTEEEGEPFWSQVLAKAIDKSMELTDFEPGKDDVVRLNTPKRYVVEVVRGSEVEELVFVESDVPGRYVVEEQPAFEDDMGAKYGDPRNPASREIRE